VPATTPWYVGAQVPLTWTSTDTSGNSHEAAVVTVTVVAPDGTTSTPTVTHEGGGQYTAVFTSAVAGHHVVSWAAADTGYADAFGDTFEVQALPDPTIVSLAEAKEILKLTETTQFDAVVQGHNAAVTNVVEYYCGPVVQQTIVERLPSRGVMQPLSKPPVIELVAWTQAPPGLENSGIPLPVPPSPMFPTMFFGIPYPIDQLYADPTTGIVTHTSGLPFIYGSYMWQYKAGRPVIPACIYEASKIILKHLFMVEHGGSAGGALTAGEEETIQTPMGFAIPARAYEMLTPELAASRMVAA
jgi:hypothetical protein